ncbi:guanosine-3',5'-bis(diphosphate) 3'-pyrophosphohydrolase [Haemophilus influenzae]|nr:guanosine-3',5'-bis(diphosphate) 3'-pyrophosphohydrolase [Haemophilus influenzae]RFO11969.1 guanosine-3',5'-bis(diphosphate) 3'-pyrophosphohydrolase [Haemophilus influenzae]TWU99854.1 guanosine-3',5'-bis(diphosphate) 3'-pyrophosphohydrolase [Haemophilus influenzae]
MNRQVFTVAIFPTEGLQALKSELFDIVFVEHDKLLSVLVLNIPFTKEENSIRLNLDLYVFHCQIFLQIRPLVLWI